MAYVWIVVQTKELADEINAKLPLPSEIKIEAVSYGQSLCGRNYRGMRPNVIIVKYTDEDNVWTNEVLRGNAAFNALWV